MKKRKSRKPADQDQRHPRRHGRPRQIPQILHHLARARPHQALHRPVLHLTRHVQRKNKNMINHFILLINTHYFTEGVTIIFCIINNIVK